MDVFWVYMWTRLDIFFGMFIFLSVFSGIFLTIFVIFAVDDGLSIPGLRDMMKEDFGFDVVLILVCIFVISVIFVLFLPTKESMVYMYLIPKISGLDANDARAMVETLKDIVREGAK